MIFEEDQNISSRRGHALDWLAWRFYQFLNKVAQNRFTDRANQHSDLFQEWLRGPCFARAEIQVTDCRTHSDGILRRASFGREHTDKTFLLIRRNNSTAGFFSHYITNIGWIRFAFDNGYIPVVDMKYSNNIYSANTPRRKKTNIWDCFFEQPTKFSLADVLNAKNVLVAERDPPISFRPNDSIEFLTEHLAEWHTIALNAAKPTLKFSQAIQTLMQSLFAPNEMILGVLLRGTDYIALKPPRHPRMPPCETVISDIRLLLKTNTFSKIFLVTEDPGITDKLRIEFGEMLITAQAPIHYSGRGFLSQSNEVAGNLTRAKSYALNIAILSQCEYVLAARTSGAIGAALMSKDTSHWKFYDLGVY